MADQENTKRRQWATPLALGAICFLVVFLALLPSTKHLRFFGASQTEDHPPPRFPVVRLEIVHRAKRVPIPMENINATVYHGESTFTFQSRWMHPITLTFPPICHYTFGRSQQDWPFPNTGSEIPDFAKQQREVVIPPFKSVSFTTPFNSTVMGKRPPDRNHAFVFGLPRTPCEYPVVGTVYGTKVEYVELPEEPTKTSEKK